MRKLIVLFLFSFIFTASVSAQASGGLAEEFTKLEDYLRNKKQSPEEKKKIFESNILNSIRITLNRRLADPKKELKDLKIQDVQTERLEGTNNLFVKYKNFYISYSYAVDPEEYLTTPVEEKLLEKPAGADLNASPHQDEKAQAK
ncbi:LIC11625 family surface-exposed protein [Leptospira idonii]|uniref:Uncharacterized protein n=1 Tax=Leptospira idonii TaxID=1193500 RepID=A0A4R9LYH5_9LEPT|nr:hypothetical protein [Leptospira idonii]TGN18505.1 hypothetical protein EHS15_14030 [Leptospira idonii]